MFNTLAVIQAFLRNYFKCINFSAMYYQINRTVLPIANFYARVGVFKLLLLSYFALLLLEIFLEF